MRYRVYKNLAFSDKQAIHTIAANSCVWNFSIDGMHTGTARCKFWKPNKHAPLKLRYLGHFDFYGPQSDVLKQIPTYFPEFFI